MRRSLRIITTGVVAGALTGLAAWGAALPAPPAPGDTIGLDGITHERGGPPEGRGRPEHPGGGPGGGDNDDGGDSGADLGAPIPADADVLRVGTGVRSLEPAPPEGATWETDVDACATLSPATLEALAGGDLSLTDHLAVTGSPWPENPDCIYMGGYGIGPMNPIVDVDDAHGLAVRSFAALDDEGDAVVLTVVDGEGWFWDYASKCPQTLEEGCGAKQISERMGADLGLDPAGFVIAATHSHTSPDFIGGWGFVPDWYMQQAVDAIEDSIREAVTTASPAVLEIGETRARSHNRERRDTYRSAEEQQISWVRALAVRDGRYVVDEERGAPAVLASLGAYAAHPTTKGTNDGVAHADWPGLFADRVEERFGGTGMHFMSGLGNMSAAGGTEMGTRLADTLPAVGTGRVLTDTDIAVARTTWRQPATNLPLTALALPGFFDHPIDPVPAEVRTGPKPDTAPCASAAPISAEVPASAARIGTDLAITAAPGEVFANFTNTVKEKSGAAVTLALGQANDALGYMPQSFELNPIGQQGLGFVAGGYLVVNYEDSYAIDRCFGDMALETTLGLIGELRR